MNMVENKFRSFKWWAFFEKNNLNLNLVCFFVKLLLNKHSALEKLQPTLRKHVFHQSESTWNKEKVLVVLWIVIRVCISVQFLQYTHTFHSTHCHNYYYSIPWVNWRENSSVKNISKIIYHNTVELIYVNYIRYN